jgi:ferredoxin-like protein FixX
MRNVAKVNAVIPTHCRRCVECGQVFDLLSESDAQAWHYGHDCEV